MLVNLSRKTETSIASNSQSACVCVCVYSKGASYGLCSGIALYRSSSASLKSHIMYDLPFRGTNSRPGSISAECFQIPFHGILMSGTSSRTNRTSEKNRLEICQTGKCLEICLSNTYLFIYCFCGSAKLDLWKLHKMSLRKETTFVISWIYWGGS